MDFFIPPDIHGAFAAYSVLQVFAQFVLFKKFKLYDKSWDGRNPGGRQPGGRKAMRIGVRRLHGTESNSPRITRG